MLTVAIIGAGPLGRGLALAAARAGFRVFLEDVMPWNLHHAQEYIRQQLGPTMVTGELGGQNVAPVAFVSTIEEAVREADLAIDCVPDELESKLEILWLLDRMAPPRTVLATPTARLSIADLAACTNRPENCVAIVADARALAAQFPSEILIRTTAHTPAATVATVQGFWKQLGVTPRFEIEPAAGMTTAPAVPSFHSGDRLPHFLK